MSGLTPALGNLAGWHRSARGPLAPFFEAQAQLNRALNEDSGVALALLDDLSRAAKEAKRWLLRNPCPDSYLQRHFLGVIKGDLSLTHVLRELDGTPESSSRDALSREVGRCIAVIRQHSEAIDRWKEDQDA